MAETGVYLSPDANLKYVAKAKRSVKDNTFNI